MEIIYLALSTFCFLGGFVFAAVAIRSGRLHPGTWNLAIIGVGFVFQCLFLQVRGEMHGQCPITSGAEVLVFICWSIVLMYFVLGRAFRLSLLGMFTAPMVFVFQALALFLLMGDDTPIERATDVDAWKEMHASMALLSYGAFALAGVAGLMYLVQDRQLKSHKPGSLFYKLPPIRYLVDALVRLLGIGLLLLTVGIVSAFFMEEFPSTVHLVVSGSVWVIYAAVLGTHAVRRIPPKKLAVVSMGAFLVAVSTLAAL